MRNKLLMAFILAVVIPAAAADRITAREQARAIEIGKQVEVRQLSEPGKLRGRLEAVTPEAVVLRVTERNEEVSRTVPFERVKSIRQVRDRSTAAERLLHGVFVAAYAFTYVIEP